MFFLIRKLEPIFIFALDIGKLWAEFIILMAQFVQVWEQLLCFLQLIPILFDPLISNFIPS